uniref:Uncharacterized protein n=1 Tax=Tetraselmis chuii TaxID=63592 RepID=A0A7S1SQ08_9CHLO
MLGQGHGAEIDRHAMVLRLNNSPNKGHEADVGAKTTVSLINGWRLHWCGERPTCPCWPYGIDVALMAYVWEPFMLEDIKLCRSMHPNALILAVDKELEVLANRIAREYTARRFEALKDLEEKKRMLAERQKVKLNFSTGLLGVALSLGLCQRLSLYGFNRNASQHHFWESATRHEIPDHDYQSEADFYAELAMGSSSLGRYWPLPPTRFVE